jgi:hypothetical protein
MGDVRKWCELRNLQITFPSAATLKLFTCIMPKLESFKADVRRWYRVRALEPANRQQALQTFLAELPPMRELRGLSHSPPVETNRSKHGK